MDYRVVAQGKTTIPNVDDGEEFELTDVRHRLSCDPFSTVFFFVLCVQACVCPFYFSVWLLFYTLSLQRELLIWFWSLDKTWMTIILIYLHTQIIHGIQHKTFMPHHIFFCSPFNFKTKSNDFLLIIFIWVTHSIYYLSQYKNYFTTTTTAYTIYQQQHEQQPI